MSDSQFRQIADDGVVAILRDVSPNSVLDVVSAIVDGGVTTLEITADSTDVTEMINIVSESFDNVLIGAGTVLDSETARAVHLAGAEFVVCPTVNESVIKTCNRYGTLVAPGAFTPTEALRAYEAGAEVVKIFPASTGGPKHISSLQGPLSQIPLIPTGGVTPENAGKYIEAGAVAVGAGSSIVSSESLQTGAYDQITENARRMVEEVESARP